MREETEKLRIKVLVENKEKRKGTAWSKERKQRNDEKILGWDRKSNKHAFPISWANFQWRIDTNQLIFSGFHDPNFHLEYVIAIGINGNPHPANTEPNTQK